MLNFQFSNDFVIRFPSHLRTYYNLQSQKDTIMELYYIILLVYAALLVVSYNLARLYFDK